MMELLNVFFDSDYFGYLFQLIPVSFLLGGMLVFCAWALAMGFVLFARIVRS